MRSHPARQPIAAVLLLGSLAALLSACGDDPPNKPKPDDTGHTGVTDTAMQPTDTEPPPWQVSGQEGVIVAVNAAKGAGKPASYTVAAMFADQLQGLATAPWCQGGGPCISGIPATGSSIDSANTPLDPAASAWTWNGHELVIGSASLPFTYNPTSGLAWYSGVVPAAQAASPQLITFAGEWGAWEGEIQVPAALTLSSPDPAKQVMLEAPIAFRWTATGEDDVFLRVDAPGFERVWHLEDDGAYDLDLSTLPVEVGEDARIAIGRWSVDEGIEVNGNALTTISVWEQAFAPKICEPSDYPNGNIPGTGKPPQPTMAPASFAVGFRATIDGTTVRDYWLDVDQNGVDELVSSALIFEFYDDAGMSLCTIEYDASQATHVGAPAVTGGGTIFSAWDLTLGNGKSTCSALDAAVWGTEDIRSLITAIDWGFGIGTVADTEAALSAIYDWQIYEPLLAGAYLKYGTEWIEIGGAASHGLETCATIDENKVMQLKPTGAPLPTRLYEGSPVVHFDL